MNTYKIKVQSLGTSPSLDGLSDVVKYVTWKYIGSDGKNTTFLYKETLVDEPSADKFTEFSSLTEEQIISWIESKEDLVSLEKSLEDTLLEMSNPKVIEKKAPWETRIYNHTHRPHEEPPTE